GAVLRGVERLDRGARGRERIEIGALLRARVTLLPLGPLLDPRPRGARSARRVDRRTVARTVLARRGRGGAAGGPGVGPLGDPGAGPGARRHGWILLEVHDRSGEFPCERTSRFRVR